MLPRSTTAHTVFEYMPASEGHGVWALDDWRAGCIVPGVTQSSRRIVLRMDDTKLG